jgi:hypothetical protein
MMKLEPANIVCPACGNANYMRHLIGKNVGHLDLKCINCNSYFNFDELYKRRIGEALKPKPLTNADRIRAMSDEELAEQLSTKYCPNDSSYKQKCVEQVSCWSCWLGWLKKEVKDG